MIKVHQKSLKDVIINHHITWSYLIQKVQYNFNLDFNPIKMHFGVSKYYLMCLTKLEVSEFFWFFTLLLYTISVELTSKVVHKFI